MGCPHVPWPQALRFPPPHLSQGQDKAWVTPGAGPAPRKWWLCSLRAGKREKQEGGFEQLQHLLCGRMWKSQPHTREGWAIASAVSHRCWQEASHLLCLGAGRSGRQVTYLEAATPFPQTTGPFLIHPMVLEAPQGYVPPNGTWQVSVSHSLGAWLPKQLPSWTLW